MALLYVLNRDNLGGSGDTNAWQQIGLPNGIFCYRRFLEFQLLYRHDRWSPLQAFSLQFLHSQVDPRRPTRLRATLASPAPRLRFRRCPTIPTASSGLSTTASTALRNLQAAAPRFSMPTMQATSPRNSGTARKARGTPPVMPSNSRCRQWPTAGCTSAPGATTPAGQTAAHRSRRARRLRNSAQLICPAAFGRRNSAHKRKRQKPCGLWRSPSDLVAHWIMHRPIQPLDEGSELPLPPASSGLASYASPGRPVPRILWPRRVTNLRVAPHLRPLAVPAMDLRVAPNLASFRASRFLILRVAPVPQASFPASDTGLRVAPSSCISGFTGDGSSSYPESRILRRCRLADLQVAPHPGLSVSP